MTTSVCHECFLYLVTNTIAANINFIWSNNRVQSYGLFLFLFLLLLLLLLFVLMLLFLLLLLVCCSFARLIYAGVSRTVRDLGKPKARPVKDMLGKVSQTTHAVQLVL